jgi:hypothetical protein
MEVKRLKIFCNHPVINNVKLSNGNTVLNNKRIFEEEDIIFIILGVINLFHELRV